MYQKSSIYVRHLLNTEPRTVNYLIFAISFFSRFFTLNLFASIRIPNGHKLTFRHIFGNSYSRGLTVLSLQCTSFVNNSEKVTLANI